MIGRSKNKLSFNETLTRAGLGILLVLNCIAGFANAWFLYKPPSVVATATIAPCLVFGIVVLARKLVTNEDDRTSGTRMYVFTLCVLATINAVGLGRIGSIFGGPYRHNVRFETPVGWKRLPLDRKTLVAWMISPESTPEAPVAMIMVEAGGCGEKDLGEAVDDWIAKSGGKKMKTQTELGGVRAFRVKLKRSGKRVQPVEAILAKNQQNLYMIIAGVDDSGRDYSKAMEEIRTSWQWAIPDVPVEKKQQVSNPGKND